MQGIPKTPFRFFIHYLWYQKWIFSINVILVTIGIYAVASRDKSISKLFDYVTLTKSEDITWAQIRYFLMMIGGFIFTNIVCFRAGDSLSFRGFLKAGLKVKKDLFNHLKNQSANYFNNNFSGQLSAKIIQASDSIMQMLQSVFWDFYEISVYIIIRSIFMGLVNFKFAILFLSLCFFTITVSFFLSRGTSARSRNYAESKSKVSGQLVDIISNILSVKIFTNYSLEAENIDRGLKEEYAKVAAHRNSVTVLRFFIVSMNGLIQLSMFILAIYLYTQKSVTGGNIVLIVLLVNQTLQNVDRVGNILVVFSQQVGMLNNALATLTTPHTIIDSPDARVLKVQKAFITFQNTDFSYENKSKVFENLNLHIHTGQKVGLVGSSGAGKSTFINLILRFYDVTGGSIQIDGFDIRNVTQESLHKNITVIPQDTLLFHRTIRDNIAYGDPNSTEQDIIHAAKKAHAHEFILNLPQKYDSLVGERGVKLSTGQRQRIAIARAVLKNAPILILDEATSALDSESEAYIQESLKDLMKGKTVLAIAHRLSTLREMDRILVFEKGKVIEDGPPTALLKNAGQYAKLWQLQQT